MNVQSMCFTRFQEFFGVYFFSKVALGEIRPKRLIWSPQFTRLLTPWKWYECGWMYTIMYTYSDVIGTGPGRQFCTSDLDFRARNCTVAIYMYLRCVVTGHTRSLAILASLGGVIVFYIVYVWLVYSVE